MVRTPWLFLAVLLIAPTLVAAGAPTGFEGVPFATPRSALADTLFRARCHPEPDTRSGRARASRVTCPAYEMNDLGPMRVAFLFSADDRLIGYVVYIPRDRQNNVRARFESVFGPPTRRAEEGRTLVWTWASGTEAFLTPFCRGFDGCVTVRGKQP